MYVWVWGVCACVYVFVHTCIMLIVITYQGTKPSSLFAKTVDLMLVTCRWLSGSHWRCSVLLLGRWEQRIRAQCWVFNRTVAFSLESVNEISRDSVHDQWKSACRATSNHQLFN